MWLEAQLPILNVSFPWVNLKIRWLSWRSRLSLTYNQSYVLVINVSDLFITNDSLIIKTWVIQGIIDHDAVFFEGIKYQSNTQQTKTRDGSLV